MGVTQMKAFTFIGCQEYVARPTGFFSVMPREVCVYKIGADADTYISFALTSDGKVAYIEPYE